jgi:hypothetical protein
MGVPSTTFAIATFVALALPGLIFIAVRKVFEGARSSDRDTATVMAQALLFSTVLNAAYFWLWGSHLADGLTVDPAADVVRVTDPGAVGANVLMFAVLAPLAISLIFYCRIQWISVGGWIGKRIPKLKRPARRHGYSPVPNGWDFAWRTAGNGSFVRVKRSDGSWIGGWYTNGSFVSTYPEARDLFLAQQWVMTDRGAFVEPVAGSTGLWLSVTDGDVVEWRNTSEEEDDVKRA